MKFITAHFESTDFFFIRFLSLSFVMPSRLLLLLFLTAGWFHSSFLLSQGVNFELVYGTESYDDAKCIIQTFDSGYAVVGSTSGFGSGMSDIYLTKISKNGSITWQNAIGGAGIDKGNSIIQTPDSGFAITGYTNSSGNGGYDVYLVKTDSIGNTLWSKTFGGTDWDFGNSIIQTTDGNYVICGSTYSYGNGNEDVYLLKTDSTGNLMWDSAFGGSSGDAGNSVVQSPDSGYFITGYTKSFGQGDEDVYLLKTNSNGNLQWTKTYGGTGEDTGSEGKQTTDGGYIVIGTTKSFDGGNLYVYWLIKTNSSGDTTWTRKETQTYNIHGTSVCQTTDGGYIFGGYEDLLGNDNMYLFKTHGDGLWQNYITYGWIKKENASVKQTFDGGYIVVGNTNSYGMGVPNIYVVKAGSNLLSTGNVVIVVGIEENDLLNKKIILYPNPASDYLTVNTDANSILEIFDSMGKRISVAQIFKNNNTIDVSDFPDGIYLILIQNEKYSASAKIIIRH